MIKLLDMKSESDKLKLSKDRSNVILNELNKTNKVGRSLLYRINKVTDKIYSKLSPDYINSLSFIYGDF